MRISVVILTCNQEAYTLACLHSLRGLMERADCELILVDNGSTDGTADEVAALYPAVRIIRLEHNSGVAAGRNTGLRAARGRHLMILDNDTVATPDTILALSDMLDAHPEAGIIAPQLTAPDGTVQQSAKPFPGLGVKLLNYIGPGHRGYDEMPSHPFYVIGAAQMFSRDTYERTGGLDENIFYGTEDADFCMAVRKLGLDILYVPELSIVHDYQRASRRRPFSSTAMRHMRALLYFWRKHRRWF